MYNVNVYKKELIDIKNWGIKISKLIFLRWNIKVGNQLKRRV